MRRQLLCAVDLAQIAVEGGERQMTGLSGDFQKEAIPTSSRPARGAKPTRPPRRIHRPRELAWDRRGPERAPGRWCRRHVRTHAAQNKTFASRNARSVPPAEPRWQAPWQDGRQPKNARFKRTQTGRETTTCGGGLSTVVLLVDVGGVDGTRTRGLRRDRPAL